MSTSRFQQGEARIIELPVIDGNGNAVDLSTATQLRVWATQKNQNGDEVAISKYSLVPQAGYGVAKVKSGAGNEHIAQVEVTRQDSLNFSASSLGFNLIASLPDARFASGTAPKEYNFPNLYFIDVGEMKNEVLPTP
jgi:hypothetical protein